VSRGEAAVVGAVTLAAGSLTWVAGPVAAGEPVLAQVSAHGRPLAGVVEEAGAAVRCRFERPQRPVAPGQTVALYDARDPDRVLGAGVAASEVPEGAFEGAVTPGAGA
jgi:tRNA U34 2-thiouridine synthase MnmA/TrmU